MTNKFAKFDAKRLNQRENIPKSFNGLLFSETPCCVYARRTHKDKFSASPTTMHVIFCAFINKSRYALNPKQRVWCVYITTSLSVRQQHSSADGVSMLQPQPLEHASTTAPLIIS